MRIHRVDLNALIVAWGLTVAASGAWAAAVADEPSSLLTLPWMTIAGAALAAMGSSLMKTTHTILKAASVGAEISVWRRLLADAMMSLVAGTVVYGVMFAAGLRSPYLLLAAMLVVGWLGEPLAGRLFAALGDRLAQMLGPGK